MENSRRKSRTATRTATRTELGKEIEAICRDVVSEYMKQCDHYAVHEIKKTVHREREALRCEDAQRLLYLEEIRGCPPVSREITPRLQACADSDPALTSLRAVLTDARSQYEQNGNIPVVTMPDVENVPKYDAWVPVRTNFWVGKDMELEPYMPYFGDDNEGRVKAFDLFKDMSRDANQENNLSDGEVDDRGEIIEPQSEAAWVHYESLPQVRWRAACREAICTVLECEEYSHRDENVLECIGKALGIDCTKRVRTVAAIALERRENQVQGDEERERREKLKAQTNRAKSFGEDVRKIPEPDTLMMQTHNHFCATCQVFYCRMHEGRDVMPIHPIRDLEVERRRDLLSKSKAAPCSTTCCLMPVEHQSPMQLHEATEWTKEEIAILRESAPVFLKDPCSLAVSIGTRTCRDVFQKLEQPEESMRMNRCMNKYSEKRKVNSKLKSSRLMNANAKAYDDSDGDEMCIPVLGNSKKNKKKATKQWDTKNEQSTENEDFIPCYHNGPCTLDICTCVQRGLLCQSSCACNNVRFCEGGARRGMSHFVDMSPRHKGEDGMCNNRCLGCTCKTGHCNTDECECWKNNQACNPDFCNDCECNILPSQIHVSARRCRNVSVSIARHKRTIVGNSEVHGFGLFAGDEFQQGDLIGIYGGQLLDTRLADMVGRLYDAKDHTFFFDITESIVIDGGVLGMKSKFCNHTFADTPQENCHSKLVRVRGDPNIALFAKRNIKPGEELKFDYKFQSVVPSWAKKPPSPVGSPLNNQLPVQELHPNGNGNGNGNGNTRRSSSNSRRKSKSRR